MRLQGFAPYAGQSKEWRQTTSSVIESKVCAGPTLPVAVPYAGALTLEDMAWCAQVAAPRLRQWAADGRLKHEPPFTQHDAVEAAIAFSLAKAGVSQKTAPAAWNEIRPQIRKLLLSAADDPWAVVSADGPEAEALPDAVSAADAASRLGRCWVIRLRPVVQLARGRYAVLGDRIDAKGGEVSSLPEAKPSG